MSKKPVCQQRWWLRDALFSGCCLHGECVAHSSLSGGVPADLPTPLSLLHSQASPSAASVQKCPPAAGPNAKNVKQMLLDWCRAKTEPYEVNVADPGGELLPSCSYYM